MNFLLWLFSPLLDQQRPGRKEISNMLTVVLKLKLIRKALVWVTSKPDVTQKNTQIEELIPTCQLHKYSAFIPHFIFQIKVAIAMNKEEKKNTLYIIGQRAAASCDKLPWKAQRLDWAARPRH